MSLDGHAEGNEENILSEDGHAALLRLKDVSHTQKIEFEGHYYTMMARQMGDTYLNITINDGEMRPVYGCLYEIASRKVLSEDKDKISWFRNFVQGAAIVGHLLN
ncbi:hypothetical protein HYW82_01600 [Candidatus Peregrinibacteria bacterium]|nr:hypothetical protein [Candidatus Peregrinibacteria bacterium]